MIYEHKKHVREQMCHTSECNISEIDILDWHCVRSVGAKNSAYERHDQPAKPKKISSLHTTASSWLRSEGQMLQDSNGQEAVLRPFKCRQKVAKDYLCGMSLRCNYQFLSSRYGEQVIATPYCATDPLTRSRRTQLIRSKGEKARLQPMTTNAVVVIG